MFFSREMTQKVGKENKKSRTFPGKVHKRVGRTAPLGYAPALRAGDFVVTPSERFDAPTQSRSNLRKGDEESFRGKLAQREKLG